MKDFKAIKIFDTTLRDGEQAPGNAMSLAQKLKIAKLLDQAGVDYIEAGFPAASSDDYLAVEEICKAGLNATIVAFARANQEDIDLAIQSFAGHSNVQLQILLVGSEIHLQHKRGISEQQAFDEAQAAITYARSLGVQNISAGFEDAFRGSFAYLEKLTQVCLDSGATTIVYADTVGAATPEEFYSLITAAKTWIRDKVELSVHCHNDLNLALANTLAAIKAGADCIQTTLCGIGERTGNVALEEIATLLHYKKNLYQVQLTLDLKKIYTACTELAHMLKLDIWPHKPILGKYAFSTAAGIHIHGMKKDFITYEYVSPDLFGRRREFLIGRLSGRSVIRHRLEEYDLPNDSTVVNEMYSHVIASKKSELFNKKAEFIKLHTQIQKQVLTWERA